MKMFFVFFFIPKKDIASRPSKFLPSLKLFKPEIALSNFSLYCDNYLTSSVSKTLASVAVSFVAVLVILFMCTFFIRFDCLSVFSLEDVAK